MKQYIVSLNIVTSKSVQKGQVCNLLKDDSFNITDRELRSGSGRLWRIESLLDDNASLSDHIDSMVSSISSRELINCKDIVENIYFDIGVLSDAYTCTVDFSFNEIKNITNLFPGIGLSITYYPSEEDQ